MGRRKLASEQEVLDAAVRVISRGGLPRLTLARVAAEAGLAAPTLVQRFGSKRGLLLAVARREGPAVAEHLAASDRPPLEALVEGLVTLAGPLHTPAEVANHLSFLQLDLTDPEFRDLAQRHSGELHRCLAILLRRAGAAGHLPPCDVEQLARSLQVVFNGVLVQWAIDGAGSLGEALRREIRPLVGIRTPSTPSLN